VFLSGERPKLKKDWTTVQAVSMTTITVSHDLGPCAIGSRGVAGLTDRVGDSTET
jgi:malonyl CoA-acyl carrier protein transacylase